ncbi:MAG TPA: hypothetical protein VN894_07195 [Polyangiaceae bacterium]|nr:hypothetical protein [Polyangiaceae bacterium]
MNDEKPTPLQDVRKGLGLLFRAAKAAVEKLPTGGVEEVVATSAREVGRAIENVASAIEREVFGKRSGPTQSEKDATKDEPPNPEGPKPPDAA